MENILLRIKLLEDLVHMRSDVKETIQALSVFGSDVVEGEYLALLSRETVRENLERYLNGELTEEDLFLWAEALELRDDVSFGEERDETGDVFDVIYTFATPELEGPITKESVHKLKRRLET